MPRSIYFVQECPTCGRRLNIRVEYLGRRVVCQHCRGAFIAADPALRPHANHQVNSLLRATDELLTTIEERQFPSRLPHPR
jgi:hypothetical protein